MTLTPELRKCLCEAETGTRDTVLDRVSLHAVMAGLITMTVAPAVWTGKPEMRAALTEEGERELAGDRERHPEAYA